jgi:hypothetical protein
MLLKKKHMAFTVTFVVCILVVGLVSASMIQASEGVIKSKVTIIVETTSDWTRVAFNGLSIEEVYTYRVTDGEEYLHYSHPTTITYTWMDITKKRLFDTNYVRIEYALKIRVSNETVRIDITKGDVGYTTVSIYDRRGTLIESFTNMESGEDVVDWSYQVGVDPWAMNLETFYIPSDRFR